MVVVVIVVVAQVRSIHSKHSERERETSNQQNQSGGNMVYCIRGGQHTAAYNVEAIATAQSLDVTLSQSPDVTAPNWPRSNATVTS